MNATNTALSDWMLKRFPDKRINHRILFCIGLKVCIHLVLAVMVTK